MRSDARDSWSHKHPVDERLAPKAALALRVRGRPAAEAALRMVAIAEPAAALFRIVNVVATYLTFPHPGPTVVVYCGLLIINLMTIRLALRGRGPLSFGAIGVYFEVLHAFAAVALVGLTLPERTFLSQGVVIPLGTYPVPLVALLALYPRPAQPQRGWNRLLLGPLTDLALVLLIAPVSAALIVANGYDRVPLEAIGLAAVWTGTALLLGYVVWYIGVNFAQAEADAVQHSYHQFERWLHSDLRGDIAVLRRLSRKPNANVKDLEGAVRGLDAAIEGKRLQMLLDLEWVDVAVILGHHVRKFRDCLTFDEVPAVGSLRMPGPHARLLDRVLGDLLSNAANAHAEHVAVALSTTDADEMVLTVSDDGPGLDAPTLSREGTSLNLLRIELEKAGGSLTIPKRQGGGAILVAAFTTKVLQ